MLRMPQLFRKAWRDRFAALQNIPPAIKLLWQSSPNLVVTATGLRVLIAVLPLTALWIGKLIIDLVVNARQNPGPVPREIWLLLAAEFVVAALGAILGRAIDYCDGRMADKFSREVSLRVMRHAATLDLESSKIPTSTTSWIARACRRTIASECCMRLDSCCSNPSRWFRCPRRYCLFAPGCSGAVDFAVAPAFAR